MPNALNLTSGTSSSSFVSVSDSPTSAVAGNIIYTDATHSQLPIAYTNVPSLTDTAYSNVFNFYTPPNGGSVNVVDGPSGMTEINDGGGGDFGRVDLANQAAVSAAMNGGGSILTVDTTTASAGLRQLEVSSGGSTTRSTSKRRRAA